jgi:hypothetical protein
MTKWERLMKREKREQKERERTERAEDQEALLEAIEAQQRNSMEFEDWLIELLEG